MRKSGAYIRERGRPAARGHGTSEWLRLVVGGTAPPDPGPTPDPTQSGSSTSDPPYSSMIDPLG